MSEDVALAKIQGYSPPQRFMNFGVSLFRCCDRLQGFGHSCPPAAYFAQVMVLGSQVIGSLRRRGGGGGVPFIGGHFQVQWVVMRKVIRILKRVVSIVPMIRTLLPTTHEPPSRYLAKLREFGNLGLHTPPPFNPPP